MGEGKAICSQGDLGRHSISAVADSVVLGSVLLEPQSSWEMDSCAVDVYPEVSSKRMDVKAPSRVLCRKKV